MKIAESCIHCGRSVAIGSGLFVDRVPDYNDVEARLTLGHKFPLGDFWCRECDANTSDSCDVEVLSRDG